MYLRLTKYHTGPVQVFLGPWRATPHRIEFGGNKVLHRRLSGRKFQVCWTSDHTQRHITQLGCSEVLSRLWRIIQQRFKVFHTKHARTSSSWWLLSVWNEVSAARDSTKRLTRMLQTFLSHIFCCLLLFWCFQWRAKSTFPPFFSKVQLSHTNFTSRQCQDPIGPVLWRSACTLVMETRAGLLDWV